MSMMGPWHGAERLRGRFLSVCRVRLRPESLNCLWGEPKVVCVWVTW